jgi:acetyltransferase-like isoleucine patch superfamily enzyme
MYVKIFWMIRALIYKSFTAKFGLLSYMGEPIYISGFKRLYIGNKVRIYPSARIEAMKNGSIIIENDVSIGQCLHVISAEKVVIGQCSTLSANVFITDVDHEYEDIDIHVMEQPLVINSTIVGKNCFIGYGAVIRAGTKLGKQCIVGANSVVKGEFPDYCVIAGNPAKIIKKYNIDSCQWERV